MRRGKHGRGNKSLLLIVVLAMSLLMGGVVGGTAAWLAAKSTPVVNTFAPSTIGLTLTEEQENFTMVPGHAIDKAPRITVTANSEACWLFVEVTASENLSTYIDYAVNTGTAAAVNGVTHGGWEQGDGSGVPANVYYRKVDKPAADQVFAVLGGGTLSGSTYSWANDQVLTRPGVTVEQMTAAGTAQPSLSFTAYAVQRNNGVNEFTAAQAWAQRMQ